MATKKSSKKAAAVPSATKLKTLQASLNSDKKLRSAFIKDPGAALRAQGIDLGAAKEQQIAKYLGDMTAPQRNAFAAEFLRIQIGIIVRIRIRISIGITI
jgi:hypothetical protein